MARVGKFSGKEISVFFPAYNIENQIKKTVERAYEIIPPLFSNFEIIVVNDGSTDATAKSLKALKAKHKDLRIVTHKKNRGYGGALKSGFYSASKDWIVFTDGDGQFDLSEITKFLSKQAQTDADLVIGYYKKRHVHWTVVLTSKIWEAVVFALFGLRVRDVDCGFKLIKKQVIDTIPKLESERGAFISSELLIKAQKSGFKIVEVGVSHYEREEDKASATGRDLNVIIKSLIDLVKLRFKI